MERLTKKYENGNVTLDAAVFMETQETIDREIQNCYPAKKAVERLAEYEDAEEREQTAATNEELIKTMCTDDFNKFLFRFKVNAVANFLESGGVNIMDAVQQKEWLQSENKEFLFKLMRDEEE